MSDRDRDRYRPKTPPRSVRAQTARPERDTETDFETDAVPEHEIPDLEARTPVHGDPFVRMEFRQKRASRQLFELASRHQMIAGEVAKLDERIEAVDGKLDTLLQAELADRRARADRAETARIDLDRAKAAADEEDRRREYELRRTTGAFRVKVILAIVAAISTTVGAYFAGGGGQ